MPAQTSLSSKTFNYNRLKKTFYKKTIFKQWVSTNPAFHQPEEVNHTQENTRTKSQTSRPKVGAKVPHHHNKIMGIKKHCSMITQHQSDQLKETE